MKKLTDKERIANLSAQVARMNMRVAQVEAALVAVQDDVKRLSAQVERALDPQRNAMPAKPRPGPTVMIL